MGQPGSPADRKDSDAPPTSGSRAATSARAPDGPAIAPLTKLVSHIPPAPRVPKVDGVSLIASTVNDREHASAAGGPDTSASAPRFLLRRQAREVDAAQAWGAVIAAVLLGVLIVWASSR
jgi:hypothetical protein